MFSRQTSLPPYARPLLARAHEPKPYPPLPTPSTPNLHAPDGETLALRWRRLPMIVLPPANGAAVWPQRACIFRATIDRCESLPLWRRRLPIAVKPPAGGAAVRSQCACVPHAAADRRESLSFGRRDGVVPPADGVAIARSAHVWLAPLLIDANRFPSGGDAGGDGWPCMFPQQTGLPSGRSAHVCS